MEELARMFQGTSKVVISPDEMRAWVILPPPQKNCPYTIEGLRAWLLQNGVTFGIREDMLKRALREREDGELLEVARGQEPTEGKNGHLSFQVVPKENAGLRTNMDGSLILDDLSFLHEIEAGTVLADIVPAVQGTSGTCVNGRELPPKYPVHEAKPLGGEGFDKTDDGTQYIAAVRSHIRFSDGEVQLTPVLRVENLSPEDGPLEFWGDIVVEDEVADGSVIKSGASVFVGGRCFEANIEAERTIVACGGVYSSQGRSHLKAQEHVCGLYFEQATILAGRDVCATRLRGCEVWADGQVRILGQQGYITACEVYAKGGLVCQNLGGEGDTEVHVGLEKKLIDRQKQVAKSVEKRTQDVQHVMQTLTAYEKLNRNKPNGGKDAQEYKDLLQKKNTTLRVLSMLEQERFKLKRKIDSMSAVGIVVRERVYPGVRVSLDTREYHVERKLGRVRFKRDGEYIQLLTAF